MNFEIEKPLIKRDFSYIFNCFNGEITVTLFLTEDDYKRLKEVIK